MNTNYTSKQNSNKKRDVLIVIIILLGIVALGAGVYAGFTFQKKNTSKRTIDPPEYSVKPGQYSEIQFVQITVNDANHLKVYYTTDGTTPHQYSNEYIYGDKIQIDTDMTLKSIAVDKNGHFSDVATAEYIINLDNNAISSEKSQAPHYIFIIKDISWEKAREDCVNRGGHLVTFDSEDEYNTVIDYIKQRSELIDKKFYIGGTRTNYEYQWVDSAGNNYGSSLNNSTHWIPGDPSFRDGNIDENYMMLYYYDRGGYWAWADVPNDVPNLVSDYVGKIGYICEID